MGFGDENGMAKENAVESLLRARGPQRVAFPHPLGGASSTAGGPPGLGVGRGLKRRPQPSHPPPASRAKTGARSGYPWPPDQRQLLLPVGDN